ncbi:tail assembly chaperone [Streptomyces phage Pablito]|uniref:Tail chaperone n=1 Tax=Streptomyces phage Pablito TaxID=2894593 RepID=A0AAE8YGS7_9CAUD|nr:tail assembly chaperone [Streptomyces phage Pablito]UFD97954.1 putative tail chaperone [Streptomyces phage Pablito]
MAQFSLDDIRAAADAKYGSTDIKVNETTTVSLLNPLRLPKAKRDELSSIQDKMDADGADQEALLAGAIVLVADHPKKGEALVKAVNGDLAVLAQIFETYSKGAQVGEASASAS